MGGCDTSQAVEFLINLMCNRLMRSNNLQFNVIFKSEPEGGFTASVPSLPGCISFGRDLVEAKNMIIDAIKGYVISLKKHKEKEP